LHYPLLVYGYNPGWSNSIKPIEMKRYHISTFMQVQFFQVPDFTVIDLMKLIAAADDEDEEVISRRDKVRDIKSDRR